VETTAGTQKLFIELEQLFAV